MSERFAEISISNNGSRPLVDLSVPFGTPLAETMKLHEVLSKDIFQKIGPRACPNCHSGFDILLRWRFEEVFRVNLDTMRMAK